MRPFALLCLGALLQASVASAAGPEPRDAPQHAALAPPARRDDATRTVAILEPQVGLGGRHFDYVDRVTAGLRSYDLAAAPRVGVAGAVYPFARSHDISRALGIGASCATALGLQSARTGAAAVDTSWTSYDVGLRARVALPGEASLVGKLGYSAIDFGFAEEPGALRTTTQGTQTRAVLPSVSYRFVRAGLDVRVPVWKLVVLGGGDYLAVQSAGALGERFPRAKVGGLEARLGLALPLATGFELRSGLVYERFFYDFRPEKGDANVAGGALDQLTAWETALTLAY